MRVIVSTASRDPAIGEDSDFEEHEEAEEEDEEERELVPLLRAPLVHLLLGEEQRERFRH